MICRECKHCKRLYVPVVPSLDHARAVRDRFVCVAMANEGTVQYLGDDEDKCELFSPKSPEIVKVDFCVGEHPARLVVKIDGEEVRCERVNVMANYAVATREGAIHSFDIPEDKIELKDGVLKFNV